MYDITFSEKSMRDMLAHRHDGRQIYGAIVAPDSGWFTRDVSSSTIEIPKIVCPYQVNDILAIQEKWARVDNGFVYKLDEPEPSEEDEDPTTYNYHTATSMPLNAVRMYARIVSIKVWPVTYDIAKNYLSIGSLSDGYPGVAKVVNYYDNGSRLLKDIRNARNKEVLNKCYQRYASSDPALVDFRAYYYVSSRRDYKYMKQEEGEQYPKLITAVKNTYRAIEKEHTKYKFSDTRNEYCGYGDPDHNSQLNAWEKIWSRYSTDADPTIEIPDPDDPEQTITVENPRYNPNLEYIGEWSESSESNTWFLYYLLNDDKLRIPKYATYETKRVDPALKLFCYLISAYLCTSDGTIIGKWFGNV